MNNFWQAKYNPLANDPTTYHPNPELISDRPLDALPDIPPNVIPNGRGKFRAYANQAGARIYLGTHESIDKAVEAQVTFKQHGIKPPRQRTPHSALPLQEIVNRVLAVLGEYNP